MPDRLQQFGCHSVPRALIPVGNHGDELINKLEEAAEEAGVDLFFSVKGEEVHVTSGIDFSITKREYYQIIQASGQDTVENGKMIVLILSRLGWENQHNVYISGAIRTDHIRQILEESNTFDFHIEVISDRDRQILMSVGCEKVPKARSYHCDVTAWCGLWTAAICGSSHRRKPDQGYLRQTV